MTKIGDNILSKRYPVPKIYGINSTPENVNAILKVLKTTKRPLNISEIQRRAKIKTYDVTRKIVYQLEQKGMVVKAFESGTGIYFEKK